MKKNDEDQKDKGFKITDRRVSSMDEGEAPKEEPRREAPPKPEQPLSQPGPAPQPGPEEMGPLTFSQFILSLATSALIQMGETPHPETGERISDIMAARQTIDIISMLRDKTKGNLERDEEHLLHDILAELQIRFAKKATGKKA